MSIAWPTITTNTVEAATRQTACAIRLLFSGEDPLAIHTLAYASYSLLRDLARKQSASENTLQQLDEDSAKFPDKKFWRMFSDLGNALKHANRSAEETPEEFNEILLFTNCMLLREVGEFSGSEISTLWLWLHACYFINIDDVPSAFWDWADSNLGALHAHTRQKKLDAASILWRSLQDIDLSKYEMRPEYKLIPWRLVMQPQGFRV